MSLPVVLRPLANADVQQIHAELEAQALGLGDKFLDRLQEALDRIEAMPERYAEVWGTVRPVSFRRLAQAEYDSAAAWYDAQQPGLGPQSWSSTPRRERFARKPLSHQPSPLAILS